MEEKKLTDEEIVKALECCTSETGICKGDCPAVILGFGATCQDNLCNLTRDLIHRLQSENEILKKQIEELPKKRKKILANRVYSDSTLKKWRKEDLIEQIRILEHNWASAEERFHNSVKNSYKIFYEKQAEIERLTEENKHLDKLLGEKRLDELTVARQIVAQNCVLNEENAELQKQVDELKQTVKDTAK